MGESAFAITVFFDLYIVNLAVYLDDQINRMTIEVRNEAVNHLLPAKVQAAEFVSTHRLPERHFRSGHLPPHPPGDFVLLRIVQSSNNPVFPHLLYLPPAPSREEG